MNRRDAETQRTIIEDSASLRLCGSIKQYSALVPGERLDRAIAEHFSDISRSYAAALIEAGAVRVNGVVASKPGQRLKAGDQIDIEMPEPQPSGIQAEDIPLSVVYEDTDLLVIDKPAGMVVHPAPGHSGGTLVNAVLARVPGLEL